YLLTLPPERIEALRTAYDPKRITFLLQELPHSRPQIALLHALFPHAQTGQYYYPDPEFKFVNLTVDRSEIAALHEPVVAVDAAHAGTAPGEILRGVKFKRESAAPESAAD